MAFTFGGVSVATKRTSLQLSEAKMILTESYKSDSKERYIVILLDRIPNAVQEKRLLNLILEENINNYTIIYPFKVALSSSEKIPGSVGEFVRTNENRWCDYVKDRKVDAIVTLGQALYCITKETGKGTLMPYHFYNYITGITYFYWNSLNWQSNPNHPVTHIFPADSVSECFPTLDTAISQANWKTYKTEFLKLQFKNVVNINKFWLPNLNIPKLYKVNSKEEADKFFEDHMNEKEISWDTETTSFNWWDPKEDFICHTFAFNDDEGYYIPWKFIDPIKEIKMFRSSKRLICANGKYDTKWLWKRAERKIDKDGKVYYIEHPECFYPTDGSDLLAHALNTGRVHGLGPLSWLYTCLGGYWQKLDHYKDVNNIKNYDDIPKDILSDYAALDPVATIRAFHACEKLCHEIDKKFPNTKDERYTIWSFYKERMAYSYPNWIDLEYYGVYVNKDFILETQAKLEKELTELKEKLCNLWKEPSGGIIATPEDIGSATKLGKAFMQMQWEPVELNKSGIYTTGDDSLNVWVRNNRPGATDLVRFRRVLKCLGTFIGASGSGEYANAFADDEEVSNEEESENGWLKLLIYHPEDKSWRLHPSHNFMMTETTRDSCFNPNLQQLTSKGDLAEIVLRNMWVDKPGETDMLTGDYSSLQARIALQDTYFNDKYCPDPGLIKVYGPEGNDDLHSTTATGVFEEPVGGKVVDIKDENGKTYMFGAKSWIKVKRDGKFIKIKAIDIQETDEMPNTQEVVIEKFGKEETEKISEVDEEKILDWKD
jgi:DNA polymerase I-like protein with 3'-5' exonuclease and polymerase domains